MTCGGAPILFHAESMRTISESGLFIWAAVAEYILAKLRKDVEKRLCVVIAGNSHQPPEEVGGGKD